VPQVIYEIFRMIDIIERQNDIHRP
jgi:hypothetical protein